LARAYVERLEAALAAATHERGLAEEKERLAAEGVAGLEQRLKQLRNESERLRDEGERTREEAERESARSTEATEQLDRELVETGELLARRDADLAEARQAAQAASEELAAARARLEAREQHLENAKAGIESRDRRLEVAAEQLEGRGREVRAAEAALATEQAELAAVRERVAARERELEAAGTLLAAQGAELARAREETREVRGEVRGAREEVEAAERERDATRERLQVREKHLETAQLGIVSRDRKLTAAERKLQGAEQEAASRDAALSSRDAELERLRLALRDGDRRLALAEARQAKAQQRAETFKGSLVEIRSGRSYRLMRILWRLRRPFRRAPRDAVAEGAAAEDDSDSSPGGAVAAAAAAESAAPEAAPVPEAAPAPAAKPIAAPSQPPARKPGEPLRVAAILDEMSAACFAPECELVPLTLDGWREQLDERRPDLLLVESAWNGNGGEWQYRIAQYPRKDLAGLPALRALLDGCRERGIPTAFWNKEDPVHFERFAEAATLFEHVFTTDARCIERYRALPGGGGEGGVGGRTVAALPFAAQPRIHNPAAAVPERSSSPCFAGAWYRDRHPERRRSLAALLDAARPRGLVIYDRGFGGKDGAFGFPERFAPHVLGKLPYERILDVYKSHRVFLNANSVADSPTMCSRRVFELAACDTAILSTPGAALATLLGEGMVEEATDEGGAAVALERLLGDEDERRRRTRAARRKVFAEHTYADRLATIAATAGLEAPRRDGADWELLLQPGVALSADAEADLRAASLFADADAIGIGAANGRPAPEHRPVDDLDPRALLLSRELIEQRGPPTGSPEQIQAKLRRWSDEGVHLYAADADLLSVGLAQNLAQPA
jgi:spore maturation protein CgeB